LAEPQEKHTNAIGVGVFLLLYRKERRVSNRPKFFAFSEELMPYGD
jgi:hypothetical protein